jgi:hypothetical protein
VSELPIGAVVDWDGHSPIDGETVVSVIDVAGTTYAFTTRSMWVVKPIARTQPPREGDEGIAMGYILERETAAFSAEVEAEAAILIRDGYAAPFDAIDLARENVKMRRRRAAESRPVPDPPAGAAR